MFCLVWNSPKEKNLKKYIYLLSESLKSYTSHRQTQRHHEMQPDGLKKEKDSKKQLELQTQTHECDSNRCVPPPMRLGKEKKTPHAYKNL